MSETSTPYTPASTSTTVAGNETVLLADEIKKYDTAKLIEYLQGQNLGLSETAIKNLENEEVNGGDFLDFTEQKFRDCGLKVGPASRLVKFAKDCKEKKLKAFSSYKTKKDLSEVLSKYEIVSGDITRIPQFTPHKIKNMGPVVDSNEAMRCEYIFTILHTAVSLLDGLVITPQANVIGEENTGRVDYAIKKIISEILEEIICITEGKQNQATMGICQNLLQCRSACEMNINMNKKKRKIDEAFDPDYDYVYEQLSILHKKRSQELGLKLRDVSRDSLRKKTQRAEKNYKLFEKVGLDKIKYINSYSANSISELTDAQFQEIIDYSISLEKLSPEAGHVSEISETARPEKILPEVNTPSTPQITPAKADDNDLTDLKKENFCGDIGSIS
ncbi:hypothetical protein GLOIN_2v1725482 [Rhizophagus irregularis DAOM 181602=DAOM 197198]|nr:hypothetical protein GLOIN_2v1725482 [Rhizophagus irregularis DAOM 181602=DAOM 197198]